MKHCRSLAFLALVGALWGCQTQPVSNEVSHDTAHLLNRFENRLALKLFDDAFDDMLSLDPEARTYYGIHTNDDKWTPFSYEHSLEKAELMEAHLAKIGSSLDKERLSRQNRLSYELFKYNTHRRRQSLDFWWHHYPVNQMSGRHTGMPAFLINIHPARNVNDLENYVERLKAMEAQLDALVTVMKVQEEKGITAPEFVYTYAIEDCSNLIKGAPFDATKSPSPLLADFETKVRHLDLTPEVAEELIERARSALTSRVKPGYQRLIEYLETARSRVTGNAGVWKLPQGAAYYDTYLRNYTTTEITAEEIHQLGLDEVRRIHAEMRAIMKNVGFDGSLGDFFTFTRSDPQFFLENSESGKQAYLDLAVDYIGGMRAALPQMVGTMPNADLVVKAVEPWREQSAGKAFYNPPSPTGDRPGIIYINLHDLGNMPTWELESLAYHEGIPGHHLQNAIAIQLEGLPKFRRLGSITAYGEGWGLYAEYFPLEFGFYENPWSDFGRLTAELWRAARLVVDTGLHHRKWSMDEAITYLMENTPAPEDQAIRSVERYLVMPAQATAYKIGMLRILELRRMAETRLGDDFNLSEFHDVILENGPLPLSFVEQTISRWLEEQSQRESQQ